MMTNICDYGARADGTLCTREIQAAIDAAGNGTVHIPAGTFVSGTLNLHGASLHLDKNAVLKGSPDLADYVWNGYNHNEMGQVLSLLYAMDHEQIRIWGEGCIDLNGESFYKMDEPVLPDTTVVLTDEQLAECTRRHQGRPNQPLFFLRCKHVTIEGIRVINAPCWTFAFIECEDVHMLNLMIFGSPILPNNDGMHFCSCKKVFIRGCNISTGDDCIALSSITDWDKPCEDVVISDCILESSSKAIVVGYMHSIVRNVLISNIIIRNSNRGLCIMTSSKTGLVENVQVSNAQIDTRVHAGNWWGNGEAICVMAVHHHIPSYARAEPDRLIRENVRNITLSAITCTSENALAIIGESNNISSVRLIDATIELKDSKNKMIKGNRIDLSPGSQTGALPDDGQSYWLVLEEAHDLLFERVHVNPFHGEKPGVFMQNCENITL